MYKPAEATVAYFFGENLLNRDDNFKNKIKIETSVETKMQSEKDIKRSVYRINNNFLDIKDFVTPRVESYTINKFNDNINNMRKYLHFQMTVLIWNFTIEEYVSSTIQFYMQQFPIVINQLELVP